MKVANPIYDIVFKYMMEDERIARTILSALLKVEVLAVEVRPHEYSDDTHDNLSVFRIDFGATILDAEDTSNDVKIVLKKLRFEAEAPCFLITVIEDTHVTTKCIDIKGITRERLFSDKYYRVLNLFHQMYIIDQDDYVMTQVEAIYENDEDLYGILRFLENLLADANVVSKMKEESKRHLCYNRSEMLVRYEFSVYALQVKLRLSEQESMLRATIKMLLDAGKSLEEISIALGKDLDIVTKLATE